MKFIKNTLAVILAALFVYIPLADALTPPRAVVDTYTFSVTKNVTNSGNIFGNINVPQWGSDATHAGHTLVAVYIQCDYDVYRDVDYEYAGALSGTFATKWHKDMKLELTHVGTATIVDSQNDNGDIEWLVKGPYDGTLDYAGTSGGNKIVWNSTDPFYGIINGATYRYTPGSAICSSHIGTGTVQWQVSNKLTALSFVSGLSTGMVAKNDQNCTFTLTVTYIWL